MGGNSLNHVRAKTALSSIDSGRIRQPIDVEVVFTTVINHRIVISLLYNTIDTSKLQEGHCCSISYSATRILRYYGFHNLRDY